MPFIFWPILGFGASQYRNIFPPTPATTSATKWALAVGMVYEFFYVVYIAMLMSMGSGASASNLHPLTILKSNENDGNTYATDGLYVYANDTVLPGADPESFRFVGDYEIDYRIVYYAGTTISGADPETFRTAAGEYATDATTVYYAGSPI